MFCNQANTYQSDFFIKADQNALNGVGIFYEDKRTLIQKAEDAQEAYNNIINQSQQNSEINRKLINFLHPELIELFNLQSFDRSDFQKEKSQTSRFKRNQFAIQLPLLYSTSNTSERQLFQYVQKDKNEFQQFLSNFHSHQHSVKDVQFTTTQQNDIADLNNNQNLNEYEVFQSTVRDNYGKYLRYSQNKNKMKRNIKNDFKLN